MGGYFGPQNKSRTKGGYFNMGLASLCDWLLANGFWDDLGEWCDSAKWNDGPSYVAIYDVTDSLTLPYGGGNYTDWGDGTIDQLNTHTYTTAGTYIVGIADPLAGFSHLYNPTDADKLVEVLRWDNFTTDSYIALYDVTTTLTIPHTGIIDWGDGTTNTETTHTYSTAGQYVVTITGYSELDYKNNPTDADKLIEVYQWANIIGD